MHALYFTLLGSFIIYLSEWDNDSRLRVVVPYLGCTGVRGSSRALSGAQLNLRYLENQT